MPSNPDVVISKMKIKVGDRHEIRGIVKDKEKAHEQYEDAIAAGHQAGMLETKKDDESVLQMRVGNIEPGQIIRVDITMIEQAKIFEGAFQINIPRGMMFLLTETKENSTIQIDINSTSPISNIFSPKILKKVDLGQIKNPKSLEEVYSCFLNLEDGSLLKDDSELNIYYQSIDNGKPQIFSQENNNGEIALMV